MVFLFDLLESIPKQRLTKLIQTEQMWNEPNKTD